MKDDQALLEAALLGYKAQIQEIEQKMSEIRRRIGQRDTSTSTGTATPKRTRRRLSAAARKRIAAAQKKRWAEYKKLHAAG